MQAIQHSSESDSLGSDQGQNEPIGIPDDQEAGKRRSIAIIQTANKKLTLISVLKNYNIKVLKNKNQAWASPVTCPFASHKGSKERTPSFGVNFIEGRFYCLGCKASGKAVEFIALMEGKSKLSVAKAILDHYGDSELIDDAVIEYEDPKIEAILFDLSSCIRNFYKTCSDKSKIKMVDKVVWWFDLFLTIRLGSKAGYKCQILDVEELTVRANKVKSLIQEISE